MKHPALARVFAVVLAILCLLMLLNGVTGFGKTERAQQERAAFEEKYAKRIENYISLDEQVSHSISYDEAYEQFKALLDQHDKDASQHRTDTALYTAEKGGNTMGANMIWEAMPELEGAKQELAAGKKKLEAMEAAYAANKGTIDETIAMANQGVDDCNQASVSLARLPAKLAPLLAERETLPAMPTPPEPPLIVEDPGAFETEEPQLEDFITVTPPNKPEEEMTDEDRALIEQYEQEKQDYHNAYEQYLQEKEEHDRLAELFASNEQRQAEYDEKLSAYQAELSEYTEAQSAWAEKLTSAFGPGIGLIQSLAQDMQSCAAGAAAVGSGMGMELGSAGSFDMGGFSMPSEEELASMTPEQAMAMMQTVISAMSDGFQQIASGLGSIEGEIGKARYAVIMGEEGLKKAEAELHSQLANIWYNLDQLEEKAGELREEKEKLDLEALSLDKQLMETEELKTLKNKHISARQLLVNIPEVKNRFAENGDLVESARTYLESYRAETQRLYAGRRLLNLLAVIGGVAGILGIPAAYEKIRGRFWLLAPVLLCLGCAIGADLINMRLGLGQMYSALFTAIFAVLQLLIILPKQKTISTEA